MKINKKGMTLVELIISIALLSVVLGFLFKILLDVRYEEEHAGYAVSNQINRAEIIRTIQEDILEYGMHPSVYATISAYDNLGVIDYGETKTEVDGKEVVQQRTGFIEVKNNKIIYSLENNIVYYEEDNYIINYSCNDWNELGYFKCYDEVKTWEIKDKNYKFGDFQFEEYDNGCYFKIILPVINGTNNNSTIDDIEIVGKRGYC